MGTFDFEENVTYGLVGQKVSYTLQPFEVLDARGSSEVEQGFDRHFQGAF